MAFFFVSEPDSGEHGASRSCKCYSISCAISIDAQKEKEINNNLVDYYVRAHEHLR